MTADLVRLVEQLLQLVKEREFERARGLIEEASRSRSARSFASRSEAVIETNRSLQAAKEARGRFFECVNEYPEDVRFHVEMELRPMVERLYDEEIRRLRQVKRSFSRPA